jgi:hypothetical protein
MGRPGCRRCMGALGSLISRVPLLVPRTLNSGLPPPNSAGRNPPAQRIPPMMALGQRLTGFPSPAGRRAQSGDRLLAWGLAGTADCRRRFDRRPLGRNAVVGNGRLSMYAAVRMEPLITAWPLWGATGGHCRSFWRCGAVCRLLWIAADVTSMPSLIPLGYSSPPRSLGGAPGAPPSPALCLGSSRKAPGGEGMSSSSWPPARTALGQPLLVLHRRFPLGSFSVLARGSQPSERSCLSPARLPGRAECTCSISRTCGPPRSDPASRVIVRAQATPFRSLGRGEDRPMWPCWRATPAVRYSRGIARIAPAGFVRRKTAESSRALFMGTRWLWPACRPRPRSCGSYLRTDLYSPDQDDCSARAAAGSPSHRQERGVEARSRSAGSVVLSTELTCPLFRPAIAGGITPGARALLSGGRQLILFPYNPLRPEERHGLAVAAG